MSALVAGVDSSTQSCKVVVVDAGAGRIVRQGSAPHPEGTSCPPQAWWNALQLAAERAGGLADVAAVAVGAQQHGMVALDADGEVIRDALLWNDTRSAQAAADLVAELGAQAWADAVGLVPVASYTISKLRWLADAEPDNARRVAAVALPHDWLTWKLSGSARLTDLVTDRSDASGTGYFDPVTGTYRRDLLARALRISEHAAQRIVLPRVLGPREVAGHAGVGLGLNQAVLGPGCGDNAAAALGLGLASGQTLLSLGTSGVVAVVADTPNHDGSGMIAGFADATGRYLPLVCTLNASRIVDATARVLGVDHDGFDELALAAPPGAGGLLEIPFLEGERSPNLPTATGSLLGLTLSSMTRENLARAAAEAELLLMSACLDAVRVSGANINEVTMVGGGARSRAVRELAPGVLGVPVLVPPPGEYVALGAARQAAWVVAGTDQPPQWPLEQVQRYTGDDQPRLRQRYAEAVRRLYGG